MTFWQKLPKPIIGLSPMDGVTDFPFRQITQKYGKNCHVLFTEFVHTEGIVRGKIHLFQDLFYHKKQKPIVAQLFGNNPKYFYQAAIMVAYLGFDGIDINMGCPAKSVIKKEGGAALIKNPKLAQKIIKATKKGIADFKNGIKLEDLDLCQEKITFIKNNLNYSLKKTQEIPISVKTRLGYSQNTIGNWINYLVETRPNAIIVHGRTFSQLYSGQANWEAIASVSDIVHKSNIVYLGNGDINSYNEIYQKVKKYKVDGVLIGRKALGNPWIFSDHIPSQEEKFKIMLEHAHLFNQFHHNKHFYVFRKNIGWYLKGFNGAKKYREELIKSETFDDFKQKLNFLHLS